ncbi:MULTISPECIES: NADPH-dependent F420 reductase [Pseudomonas]|uniref:NADPH-dependent F420 reductase n=1 Tax=Pseudomonas sp. CFBP2511 TaxID=3040306 RepID=UPI0009BE489E|nr:MULTISPECIES: NADPH-dependent F420 reductase [Pseudomonas]WIN08818.1 NADPH-dependent F420 reductase [Pseudomonas syringae pv. antirrhini str. 126]
MTLLYRKQYPPFRSLTCRQRTTSLKIGVLGSGRMGSNLGLMLAHAGHEVTFSYSMTEGKLAQLAKQGGPQCGYGSPAQAAAEADIVLLAVHWHQIDDVLTAAGSLDDKVVLSCCNPLNIEDTDLIIGLTSSGAEVLAEKLKQSRIVAAFQTVPSEVLMQVFRVRNQDYQRPSLVFCGNDTTSKTTVASLINQLGFDPIDAGQLKVARYIEPFGMLSGVLAYDTDQGPEWAYHFGRFPRLQG